MIFLYILVCMPLIIYSLHRHIYFTMMLLVGVFVSVLISQLKVSAFKFVIYTNDSGSGNYHTISNKAVLYTALTPFKIIPTAECYFEFTVKACHGAFVLFSDSPDLHSKNSYEIVIGGRLNAHMSVFRNGIMTKFTYVLEPLSCYEHREFTVNFTDGLLSAGLGKTVLIWWYDHDPFNITGYGVRTGYGATGQWTFVTSDCENRTYGYSCEKNCGYCKSGDTCDRLNGSCLNGCNVGWEGDKCDQIVTYKANVCTWSCKQINTSVDPQNRAREEWKQILADDLEKLTQELTINKSTLSSYKRKLGCAEDKRTSSKHIGIIGIIFISILAGIVVISDVVNIRHINRHIKHINRFLKKLFKILKSK